MSLDFNTLDLLRQVVVPGVHSKFIEAHRRVLIQWLDRVLPPEVINTSARGVSGFTRRYGFLDKPQRIRLCGRYSPVWRAPTG